MDPFAQIHPVPKPRLLDQVRAELRKRRYSPRTEEAYVSWIRRFIRFHRMRHPRELGKDGIEAFLSALATGSRLREDSGSSSS